MQGKLGSIKRMSGTFISKNYMKAWIPVTVVGSVFVAVLVVIGALFMYERHKNSKVQKVNLIA